MGMYSHTFKGHNKQPCSCCNTVEVEGQWWMLRNYFKVNGYFCPNYYEMVSHDCYGKPKHPERYTAVLIAQQLNVVNGGLK
jgi:hypothetical protein